jgi:hypothetical protein
MKKPIANRPAPQRPEIAELAAARSELGRIAGMLGVSTHAQIGPAIVVLQHQLEVANQKWQVAHKVIAAGPPEVAEGPIAAWLHRLFG